MVNEEKVRIMAQIALDETKYHKKEIREGEYDKSDYVRSHVISAIWNVTISYIFILCLIALYYADYIFLNVARLAYERLYFTGDLYYFYYFNDSDVVFILFKKVYTQPENIGRIL